ncbi:MAG TPA: TonB-dependent receptor [Steroidobacteraceae bacterium]|nr:TonB-dependent receptor [Steroidobacteraceae bacterium]
MTKHPLLLLATAAAGALTSLAPHAADKRAATDPLETVEVFGRRIEGLGLGQDTAAGSRLDLSPLETPASIEVLAGDVIRQRGDLSVVESVTRASGITSEATPGDGGTALSARGFVGHNSVMQLLDGARLYVGAGTVTFPFDTWSVDRIEVLHGPASVMYGQGAIGGVVNVVSRQPNTQAQEAQVGLAFGEDQRSHAAVDLTGPLGDSWAYRFDVSYNRADNWIDRGDSDSLAISGTLQWDVSDTLRLSLSHDYGDQHPMEYFGTPLIDGRLDESLRHENYNVGDSKLHYRDAWTRLKAQWQASETVQVNNQLYWLDTDRQWRNVEEYEWNSATGEIDRFSYTGILHHQEQVGDTADVRVEHQLFGRENHVAVGVDFNHIRFTHVNDFADPQFDAFSSVPVRNFDPGAFLDLAPTIPRFRTRTDQYSLFFEDRMVLNEQWSLIGGARYDNAQVDRFNLINPAASFDASFSDTSWRVGMVFQPVTTLSFYAQYATAVDPLGSVITTSASQADLDLATGTQIEAGVKQSLWDQRLEWTLAAYRIVKKDLLTQDPTSANPEDVQQVGQQSSRGIEASLALNIADRWRIDANVALLNAKFDDFGEEDDDGNIVSRNGRRPPSVPEQAANLWASWAVTEQWRARAGLRYVGKRFTDNGNQLELPSYTVIDAGVDWAPTPQLALTAALRNVTDEVYAVSAYTTSQWILGQPRTAELQARYRFR